MKTITVETFIHAPIEKVWNDFTNPEAVKIWNVASEDWHTIRAENNLEVGGNFLYRIEAIDGSDGFDFAGTYDMVLEHNHIAYTMSDNRKVRVTFQTEDDGVRVVKTFDIEEENTPEAQHEGWQGILDNFKKYVESEGSNMGLE